MKVLITGATGLIGKNLSVACRSQGIAVNYLTTSKSKIVSEPDYKGFYWNPSTGEIDETCFDGVRTIIHLAGSTIAERWTKKRKKVILESRIDTGSLLFSALSRKCPQTLTHFVSASGIACYPSSETKFYDEKYPTFSESFLGQVVKVWEAEAMKFHELDLTVSCMRTGVVLDPKEGALPKLVKPIRYGVGASLGSGKQWQSWIHINDLVGTYMHVIKNQLGGIFNAVATQPVTNEKMNSIISNKLKKPLFMPKIPRRFLKLMLGEMSALVLESQKVDNEKIRHEGYVFQYAELEEAIDHLL